MEEYHRDSLRQLRRMELEEQAVKRARGSLWVTLLIIALFLTAGGFYLKTTDRLPDLSSFRQTVVQWADELTSVVQHRPDTDVQATVDEALAQQNEAG